MQFCSILSKPKQGEQIFCKDQVLLHSITATAKNFEQWQNKKTSAENYMKIVIHLNIA